jgi:hypothetical protein
MGRCLFNAAARALLVALVPTSAIERHNHQRDHSGAATSAHSHRRSGSLTATPAAATTTACAGASTPLRC